MAVTPFEKREYRDRCPAEPPVGLLALVRSLSGLRQGKHITVRVFEPRHLRSACLRADQRSDSLPVPVLRTPLVLLIHTRPRKSWTASACLCVHHPLTRLCHPLKRTGSEDGKRPKPDSCAWVVNLAYPERSFVVILPSWRPPAQHNTPTATFRSCVLPVPVLRTPLVLLIRIAGKSRNLDLRRMPQLLVIEGSAFRDYSGNRAVIDHPCPKQVL